MAFNDTLSDMLARIKNAHKANKTYASCYKSKLNSNVLTVLKDEGYIRDFQDVELRKGISNIKIDLKYYNGIPVIKKIKRISKPGIRIYSKINDLPKPYGGLGISILSTPKGVMSDKKARDNNVGGEILCEVFWFMSRVAKNSIKIPIDTTCKFENNVFFAKGKLGEMSMNVNLLFNVNLNEGEINVLPKSEKDKSNPIWGTTRALVSNVVKGVSEGFSKTLELNGTGYRASISGSKLKLQLGFSHDIDFEVPKEVKIECPKQNIIKLSGSNKEILGAVAANIRSFRKPEPFKGKGIKYENEFIFRKEGKKK